MDKYQVQEGGAMEIIKLPQLKYWTDSLIKSIKIPPISMGYEKRQALVAQQLKERYLFSLLSHPQLRMRSDNYWDILAMDKILDHDLALREQREKQKKLKKKRSSPI